MVSPCETSVFSRAMYSTRTVESDVVTDSSRMMTQSMLWVIEELTSMMLSTPLLAVRSGRASRKAATSRIAMNTKNLGFTRLLRIVLAPNVEDFA